MMSPKIGLEFEGVILDKDGAVTRWSKIPRDKQFRIKTRMDMMDSPVDPCDGYDCLAEVRTAPLDNPTAEELIEAFLAQVELANKAYQSEGYRIVWAETPIPSELHKEICGDLANATKKDTMTIVDGRVTGYVSDGNVFRGGGIHVNVSPIHPKLVPVFAMDLHSSMLIQLGQQRHEFRSNYRNNLLFRSRRDENNHEVWIGEYMSFGMNFHDNPADPGLRDLESWNHPFKWTRAVIAAAYTWTKFKLAQ